jgi:O-antigen ligase
MKWIAILVVMALLPAAIGWMRNNPQQLPRVMIALGLAPFFSGLLHLTASPIAWPGWPGFNKGLELSIVDAMAIVLIAAAPPRARVAHLRWPIGVFAILVLLSATQTDVPTPTLFYAWQLGRVALLATAVAIACRDPRAPAALLKGLIFGLAYQALMSINERAHGVVQAAGTFGHQNLLGMITHFVVFPSLAVLLATKKVKWMWLGPVAGGIIAILAASRATLGLSAAGVVLVLGLSLLRRSTARKRKVAALGLVGLAIAAPLAMATLGARFEKAPLESGYDERAAFERAAKAMLHDYPLGVGANHYVIVANTLGYSERAGVAPVFGSRSAHVHNLYLLTAAETGYAGFVAIILMMVVPIVTALRCAWRFRNDPRGELLVGAAVAVTIAALHSMYEWIFVYAVVQYLYAMMVGLIAGLGQQMGYWAPARRRRAAPPPSGDDGALTPHGPGPPDTRGAMFTAP